MKYFSSYFYNSPFEDLWNFHNTDWNHHSLWEPWAYHGLLQPVDSSENSTYPYNPRKDKPYSKGSIKNKSQTAKDNSNIEHSSSSYKKLEQEKIPKRNIETSPRNLNEDWYFTDGFESSSDDNDDDSQDLGKRIWISELHLTMKDKKELLTGKMLSDKHMCAAQKLLAKQFPFMQGFQDTCLAQTKFNTLDNVCDGASLQIHHVRGNHWILSASIVSDIYVYDSIYNKLTPDLLKQLKEIYTDLRESQGNLNVIMPNIKSQKGNRDCGLFVIAYAVDICNGYDPSAFKYDQNKMRQHFRNCLERGELSRFPVENVNGEYDFESNFKEAIV